MFNKPVSIMVWAKASLRWRLQNGGQQMSSLCFKQRSKLNHFLFSSIVKLVLFTGFEAQ